MGTYICEKCGTIDNTSVGGYWENLRNGQPKMCSECNKGKWHGKFPKKHWSEYGIDKLLELERQKNGSMLNATNYLKSIGKI